MRIVKQAVVCFLILLGTQTKAVENSLSLEIRGPETPVSNGSEIRILIITTNNSKSTVTYYDSSPDCDYTVIVLKGGAPARKTTYKESLNCEAGLKSKGRNILRTLKPGESRQDDIGITHLYPMTEPDAYSVQVERTFPEIGHFNSNIFEVTVTK